MKRLHSNLGDSRMVETPPKRKRHRSPSDVRREAKRNAERQAEIRSERVEQAARADRVNLFMARSLDRQQQGLDAEKLRLRREVRETGELPSEGSSFDGRRV